MKKHVTLFSLLVFFVLPTFVLAQNCPSGEICVGEITGGRGPLANGGVNSGNLFASVLSSTVGVLTIVAAIWFLFNIITGGISIIGAGGDKGRVEGARSKITNGVVGLIIVITAVMLVGFVGWILGIDNPLDIAGTINRIGVGN